MAEVTFVERKPMNGREHPLEGDVTIGREGCDVVLADPEVSRRHAMLRRTANGAVVEDLGSTNGTFVNGERIQGVRDLADGDVIAFGNTEWQVRAAAPAVVGSPQVTAARSIPVEPPAPAATTAGVAPAAAPPAPAAAAAAAPRPAAPAQPAQPVAADGRRGDVPAPPEITPSAIHRTLPESAKSAPPAFSPVGTRQIKGSAATRAGYTAFCMLVFLIALVATTLYFALQ
jgi:pSer/pThr/pTyr-binding forkhead associated (FHA) protein